MPAVHVEPCFISNPQEEARLLDEAFRAKLATAIADAIERYFRLGEPGRVPVDGVLDADAPSSDGGATAGGA
jgi:hypothetical protein